MDLTNKVHSLSADLRSLEIQLNHSRLQVESLSLTERDLHNERDSLQFALAESEQDRLLMETKLANIAGFEGGRGGNDLSIEAIRGKLLDMANKSIGELNETIREQRNADQSEKKNAQISKLSSQNKSLRVELKDLTDQLAQRTVLYAAQERKYNDSMRTNHTHHTEKSDEISQLRARLQQMEKQFEHVDRERVEAILRGREQDTSQETLQEQLSEAVERAQQLDLELTTLTTQNSTLQTTIQHLRGANFEELERGLVAEVEIIKAESASREADLKQQLESARELITQEAQNRDALVDEIVQLRDEVEGKVELLHKVHSAQRKGTLADATKHLAPISSEGDGAEPFIEHKGDSEKDFSALFDEAEDGPTSRPISPRAASDPFYDSSAGPNILYGSNLTHSTLHVLRVLVSELFGEGETSDANESVLLEIIREGSRWHGEADSGDTFQGLQSRIKSMIEDAYESVHRDLDDQNPWAQLSLAVTNILGGVASFVEQVKRRERKADKLRVKGTSRALDDVSLATSTTSAVLTKSFLIGDEAEESVLAGDETVATSVADALQEELTALKEELVVRRRREQRLRQSLKEQGGKLATVLQRAAQLSQPDETTPTPTLVAADVTRVSTDMSAAALKDATIGAEKARVDLAREKADKGVLEERAAGYQEEIHALQEEVESCHRLLKLTGDSTGKGYMQQIVSLDSQLKQLKENAGKDKENKGVQVSGSRTEGDGDADEDTVVDALADQFQEVNKRKFLEAELVVLQDRLSDMEEELGEVREELQKALQAGKAESQETGARASALESERDEMKKQMEALVSSMKQEYENKIKVLQEVKVGEPSSRSGESYDVAMQTEFNPGDSVVDQRVQFAVAQQRISDEQKWSQTLEVQRLSLVREHQLDLAHKVAALQREFEEEIATTQKDTKCKYKARMRDMRDRHEQEKGQLIKLIKKLGEGSEQHEDTSEEADKVRVFPEMLSPEQTAAMVKSISGHPLGVSQTVMRASIDSSSASSATGSYREGPSQASNEVSFQSDDLDFRSARNSTEALETSVDVSKQSLDSSMTASPPHWESQALEASPTTGEDRNVSTMETPPVHASKTTSSSSSSSSKTGRGATSSQRKPKSSKLSSPSRRVYGKDTSPPSAGALSSLRRSVDRSPEKVLKPAMVSRTPELSRQNTSSSRKKRGTDLSGKTISKTGGVPRRFPLTGV